MTNLSSKSSNYCESDNYRNLVSSIHYKFEELKEILLSNKLNESKFFVEVAYKSFTDKILKDFEN